MSTPGSELLKLIAEAREKARPVGQHPEVEGDLPGAVWALADAVEGLLRETLPIRPLDVEPPPDLRHPFAARLAWRTLMERDHGDGRTEERLRITAQGAVEDWLQERGRR